MCNCCWNKFNFDHDDNKLNFNKFENDRKKDDDKGFHKCVLKCCVCCFKIDEERNDKCDRDDDKFDRCEKFERCNCHEKRKPECERRHCCCRCNGFWN